MMREKRVPFVKIAYLLCLMAACLGAWFTSMDCTFFVTYDDTTFAEAYQDEPIRSVSLLGSHMHLMEGKLFRNATVIKMIWYPAEEYYCERNGEGVEDGLAAASAVFLITSTSLVLIFSLVGTGDFDVYTQMLLITAWISNILTFLIFRNCGIWDEGEWCEFGEAGVFAIVNGSLLLPGAILLHIRLQKERKKNCTATLIDSDSNHDDTVATMEDVAIEKSMDDLLCKTNTDVVSNL